MEYDKANRLTEVAGAGKAVSLSYDKANRHKIGHWVSQAPSVASEFANSGVGKWNGARDHELERTFTCIAERVAGKSAKCDARKKLNDWKNPKNPNRPPIPPPPGAPGKSLAPE